MRKLKQLGLFLLIFNISCAVSKGKSQSPVPLTYELSMPQPQTHIFKVKMTVSDFMTNSDFLDKDHLTVKMPVWTPGSYLVREFARNITTISAKDKAGKELKMRKVNKNTWIVDTERTNEIVIEYDVYAYELTVRTSFLDQAHGYVNGASVFLYVPELEDKVSKLVVNPFTGWKTISTALPAIDEHSFVIKNYDTLVDSPIEIGNHEVLEFTAAGVPHKIAMFSTEPLNYNKEQLLKDYKKMVEAATSVVGVTPLDHYLFIVHHQRGIGGGLEHLYSTTCQTSPQAYDTESGYKGLFSLLAHEYFHLWNVKRIRPIALGPFDYENENYTHMLWVAEGFTNYYEEVILSRAGIYSEEDVLSNLQSAISNVENTPGNAVQPVTESSWDAWIKYYRPDENSSNSGISYYSKGGILAALLNAIIIDNTNAQKSLDDVLALLYNKYYLGLGRGYTDEEFQYACEEIAGKSLNDFFANYVSGTMTPEYEAILGKIGIEVTIDKSSKSTPYLGVIERGGRVLRVYSNGSAYLSGLNVNDEIVSIDGQSSITLNNTLENKKIGETLTVVVKRAGVEQTIAVPVAADQRPTFTIKKAENMSISMKSAFEKFTVGS